jgi:hypothetical protein
LQQLVADLVTVRVVDVLETIQVDEQHGQRHFLAAGFFDGRRQMRGQEQAVRQAGQLVMVGEAIESLLFLQQLGFDLAADQAAMLHLLDELLMARLGLDYARGHLAHAQLEVDDPRRDGAEHSSDTNDEVDH